MSVVVTFSEPVYLDGLVAVSLRGKGILWCEDSRYCPKSADDASVALRLKDFGGLALEQGYLVERFVLRRVRRSWTPMEIGRSMPSNRSLSADVYVVVVGGADDPNPPLMLVSSAYPHSDGMRFGPEWNVNVKSGDCLCGLF